MGTALERPLGIDMSTGELKTVYRYLKPRSYQFHRTLERPTGRYIQIHHFVLCLRESILQNII